MTTCGVSWLTCTRPGTTRCWPAASPRWPRTRSGCSRSSRSSSAGSPRRLRPSRCAPGPAADGNTAEPIRTITAVTGRPRIVAGGAGSVPRGRPRSDAMRQPDENGEARTAVELRDEVAADRDEVAEQRDTRSAERDRAAALRDDVADERAGATTDHAQQLADRLWQAG